jgi:hypothetical protein
MIIVRDPMQKSTWFEPRRVHGTIRRFQGEAWRARARPGTEDATDGYQCAPKRFRAVSPHPTVAYGSTQRKKARHARKSAAWGRCRGRDGAHGRNREHASGRHRCGDGRRRGGGGDGGNSTGDDGGGGGVDERSIACASRAQELVST